MDWSKTARGLGAVGAAAAQHGWVAAAILLGPVVVVAVVCIVLVLCVEKVKRPEAIAALTPVLIAAVTWRPKDGRSRKGHKAKAEVAPDSAKKKLSRK